MDEESTILVLITTTHCEGILLRSLKVAIHRDKKGINFHSENFDDSGEALGKRLNDTFLKL